MSTATKTLWNIDTTHSEVQFKVKHLVISKVTGSFNSFSGSLETDGEDLANGTAYFEASIDSIDTNNPDRDAHLKSPDFFDAENHPKLTFQSTAIVKSSEGQYEVIGDLTIRGNTKSVTLKAELGGMATDPYGNYKAGYELSGKIDRKAFGLEWSALTEAGGVVVGDQVELVLNIQVVKS